MKQSCAWSDDGTSCPVATHDVHVPEKGHTYPACSGHAAEIEVERPGWTVTAK